MAERNAFEEWWERTQGVPWIAEAEIGFLREAFEAGARSRDAEVERASYDRGYETGCAAASYTNEESNLPHIDVLREALLELLDTIPDDESSEDDHQRFIAAIRRADAVLGEASDA